MLRRRIFLMRGRGRILFILTRLGLIRMYVFFFVLNEGYFLLNNEAILGRRRHRLSIHYIPQTPTNPRAESQRLCHPHLHNRPRNRQFNIPTRPNQRIPLGCSGRLPHLQTRKILLLVYRGGGNRKRTLRMGKPEFQRALWTVETG